MLFENNNDKKSIEKVKRDTLRQDYPHGGLKMFDMISIQDSYKLNWGERLLSDDNPH